MNAGERDWAAYYATTAGRPPRPTLLFALDRFGPERGFAVDLGCGNGRDTVEIVRRRWRVLAIDAEPEAVKALRARPDMPGDAELETATGRFEDVDWPAADLVNSSFALPLCPPDRFPFVWGKLLASLKPGGCFAGQLFGERDSFADDRGVTTLSREEAEALLASLEIELFQEEEEDGVTPRGRAKHWHIFHIVARRR